MTLPATDVDVIAALAGIAAGSSLAALRAQRPEAAQHAQGSYTALFSPPDDAPLGLEERLAVAAHVAALHADAALRAHYAVSATSPRSNAMLRHADLLSTHPVDAGPDNLQALADAGLSTREIVTLSQVIAFVAFQARVIAALRLLGDPSATATSVARAELRPARSAAAEPARVVRPPADLRRPTAFTIAQLDWTPWLEPLDFAQATPTQATALEGQRANSAYFRLLALDAEVLIERTATDRGIFYTPGGAPRQDRELAAAATSRLNGCIYCTSVHARLASQLSKRTDAIEHLLQRGVAPGTELDLDNRWQAVVDAAVALAPTPPRLTAAHIDRLRNVGLSDLEILDVLQAAAFFAWANRLMLTLGEPYVPVAN